MEMEKTFVVVGILVVEPDAKLRDMIADTLTV